MKRDVTLEYEDSHRGYNKGITYYYFNEEFDGIDYYIATYFLHNKLNGICVSLYTKNSYGLNFNDKVSNVVEVVLEQKKFLKDSFDINIDTCSVKSHDTDKHNEFFISIYTEKLNGLENIGCPIRL